MTKDPETSFFSQDIIWTSKASIPCDGHLQALGHPLVYLDVTPSETTHCPYCSQGFGYMGHDKKSS